MHYLRIAAIGSGLAGVSHITLLAYSLLGMPFYLVSFLAIGIIQIALAVWLWKGKLSQELFWTATLVNGVATMFWLLTRVMVAPFIGGVEHFSVIGITVVALQILSIICVCLERKNVLHFVLVLLGSAGLGFAAHFGAIQLEHHFPGLKGTGGHHGSGGHGGGMEHHSMSTNGHGDKNMMEGHSETMNTHHAEDADHHMSDQEHSDVMNHNEESETAHDHAECDGNACPLETSKTEESKQPNNLELLVETSAETETQVDDDHHDEPHGH